LVVDEAAAATEAAPWAQSDSNLAVVPYSGKQLDEGCDAFPINSDQLVMFDAASTGYAPPPPNRLEYFFLYLLCACNNSQSVYLIDVERRLIGCNNQSSVSFFCVVATFRVMANVQMGRQVCLLLPLRTASH
jgi:hypothetical protein